MFMIPTGDKCTQCNGPMYFVGLGESISSHDQVEMHRCRKMGHVEEKPIVRNKDDHKYEDK